MLVPVVAIYALINTATYASALISDASGLYVVVLLLLDHSLSPPPPPSFPLRFHMLCTRMYVCMYLVVPRALACLCPRSGHYLRLGTSYVLAKREQLYFAAAYLEILLLPLMVIKFFQGYARPPPQFVRFSSLCVLLCCRRGVVVVVVVVAALTPLGTLQVCGADGCGAVLPVRVGALPIQ